MRASHGMPASWASAASAAPARPAAHPATNAPPAHARSPPAGDGDGFQLYTMDHDTGDLRLDLAHRWDDPSPPQVGPGSRAIGVRWAPPNARSSRPRARSPPALAFLPQPITPEEELICDPSAGWLCSKVDCALGCVGAAGRRSICHAAGLAVGAVRSGRPMFRQPHLDPAPSLSVPCLAAQG